MALRDKEYHSSSNYRDAYQKQKNSNVIDIKGYLEVFLGQHEQLSYPSNHIALICKIMKLTSTNIISSSLLQNSVYPPD